MSAYQRGFDTPIITALIAGFVAVVGVIANLYAAYRLKKKEFRVTQIKSRLDTLEQAAVFGDRESTLSEPVEAEDPLSQAHEGMIKAAWARLVETKRQYAKCKWLLNRASHKHLEELQRESNALSSILAVAHATQDRQTFREQFPEFYGKTQSFEEAYEHARLSEIERLYGLLDKEVGISSQNPS